MPNAIEYRTSAGLAFITLNRPEKLNALREEDVAVITGLLDRADADDAVRAVVITGSGRAFCAGADLSQGGSAFDMTSHSKPGDAPWREGAGRITLRIFQCLKPVVAAINGAAVGMGATITLAADARLASTEAKFGFVFTRRGMASEGASAWFLPRLVGITKALDWCCSGRMFPAQEALAAGLVSSLHPIDELLPAAIERAHALSAHGAPVAVAVTRQMLWRGLGYTHPREANDLESLMVLSRGASPDAYEGAQSFLEKRAPQFRQAVSVDMPEGPWSLE